jgi:hypothetical protein
MKLCVYSTGCLKQRALGWLWVQIALKRLGVPFVLVRDVSLFERAEVLNLIAYLK